MKCQSVACLWSDSPPQHKVTATAILTNPPSLYTGGSDGSIIWWKFSGDNDQKDPWPMAMLCGHASAIADLNICNPTLGDGKKENETSKSGERSGLFSVCRDGVLCVWSRGSGHCKRRRKLPPWAGTPCAVSSVPPSQRYLCVACFLSDSSASHGPSYRAVEDLEGVEREDNHRKGSKVAILIVDSCSLSIVRTVFHGVSPLGHLRCVSMIPYSEVLGKSYCVLVDLVGKVQMVAMESEQEVHGDNGVPTDTSSKSLVSAYGDSVDDGEDAISVAVHGKLLALVFESQCIFKSVLTGAVVGEISVVNTPLSEARLAGCMFLENKKVGPGGLDSEVLSEGMDDIVIIWNTTGDAITYAIRTRSKNSVSKLCFEPLSKIPCSLHQVTMKNSIYFCKLESYIVRVESVCFNAGGSLVWRPYITIWSAPELPMQHLDSNEESGREFQARESGNSNDHIVSMRLGEGGFPSCQLGYSYSGTDQVRHSKCSDETKRGSEKCSDHIYTAASESADTPPDECIISIENEETVSSSMILSKDFSAPYAVVYGFCSGYIEVIRFVDSFSEFSTAVESVKIHSKQHISKQSFLGHTGAVLCLAAHRMVATSSERSFQQVLVSGSSDCTIRIWDLDNGNLLFVLHHHVAPVKQIILPPSSTDLPWSDCFLSVGGDCCVALVSLENLRVERMFPGHPCYPSMVVWDSSRGYIASLCRDLSSPSSAFTALYLWDVKTGARERVFRGTFCYSVFDHFCSGINVNAITGNILGGSTSASLLHLPVIEDASFPATAGRSQRRNSDVVDSKTYLAQGSKVPIPHTMQNLSYDAAGQRSARQAPQQSGRHKEKHPIKCSCPFPGIAALKFSLASLISPHQTHKHAVPISGNQAITIKSDHKVNRVDSRHKSSADNSTVQESGSIEAKKSIVEYLIRFTLALLHLWDVNLELDKLLMDEMNILKPEGLFVGSGVPGDRGSMMLTFPGLHPTLELWKSSPEFCAMRSLTIVSLAQRLVTLSHSSTAASSALAAFYTRNFAEKVPDIKPPLLQLLVSFWQDPSEHVRMAARSLFHCAAPRAVPHPISVQKATQTAFSSIPIHVSVNQSHKSDTSQNNFFDPDCTEQQEETNITAWLESYEMQDWVSCIRGTIQDAMASHIIVAAALVVWYPSKVKSKLAVQVVNHLIKLVMTINDRYSSTAAELLAEGMDNTWKVYIDHEIPRLIGDIFFQIECLSVAASSNPKQNPAMTINIRESLVGILLPSLAMTDIPGFLNVIERQIWATSSDSPVHLVSVTTLVRVIRGSPKPLAPYLDKVINFILQTLDYANSDMRKICLQSSMVALREVARVFPMIALNEATSRLAVGDAIGEDHSLTIRIYDLQSMVKIKVLDASGPPGLPSLLSETSDAMTSTGISAVSFSPDGEGLVAFSEHGLVIRWWSLGMGWWEKLSRNVIPVQCTKLIFVPPWEGMSPNSSRMSIIASMVGQENGAKSPDKGRNLSDSDRLRVFIHNLDLSYRLDWIDGRKVVLNRHKRELGSFQF